MMTVAAPPVWPAWVIDWTGAYAYEVEYSVAMPMATPETRPMRMQPKYFQPVRSSSSQSAAPALGARVMAPAGLVAGVEVEEDVPVSAEKPTTRPTRR